jgi:hypothetical protein
VPGVVHPHDPLAPGQVLDRPAEVGELPVDDGGDLEGHRVQEPVVGPEVTMDEDGAGLVRTRSENARGGLLNAAQQRPAGLQDPRRVTRLHQFLARRTGHEPEREDPVLQTTDRGHRQGPPQPGQHRVLPGTPELRVRTRVGLLHHRPVTDGVVGVAVLQRTHPQIIHWGPSDRRPMAPAQPGPPGAGWTRSPPV